MTQSSFDEKRQTKDHTQDELYEGNKAGDVSQYAVVVEVEKRTTWFVWLLVTCCTISGLLFGYDTGVISGTLVTINGDLGPAQLSDGQKEFITSATTLGALLGGLAGGAMSDWTGRRLVLGIADIIFVGGALGQAVCHTVWSMNFARLVAASSSVLAWVLHHASHLYIYRSCHLHACAGAWLF